MASANVERLLSEVRRLPLAQQRQLREALDREAQAEDEHSSPRPSSTAVAADALETKRRLRRKWLEQHHAAYAGKYVALDGDQLLGVGATYSEAARAARASGAARPYIDYVPVPGSISFGGWS